MAGQLQHIASDANPECGNCGAHGTLLVCSRCRSMFFCSVQCQKAYWPFHREECHRNEFADVMEREDAKFAKWMRRHGKIATLKDDEIERLERARRAASGVSATDVMQSMYNRLNPKPKPPSYPPPSATSSRSNNPSSPWSEVDVSFGMDCQTYKWRQNLSHVELFILVPASLDSKKICVELKPRHLRVELDDEAFMEGVLFKEIKTDESFWFLSDGILHIQMLKRSRKGHYCKDDTNAADTFWRQILRSAHLSETLSLQYPPQDYYRSMYEAGHPC